MRTLVISLFVLLTISTPSQSQNNIEWDEIIEVAPRAFGYNRPRIVHNANGHPVLIWGRSKNLMFSKWDGAKFTEPIQLNVDTIEIANANWMGPDITAHGDTIYVVYKQIPESSSSSHIYCIRSSDGGVSFSNPVRVEDIGSDLSRFCTVTTDDLGNPLVGFMKFSETFLEPHWVMSKSIDDGQSFLSDVVASGQDGPSSEACDCCPGAITSYGNNIALLYRNNDGDIRDNWAGISTDGGDSFEGGMNVDQQNWELFNCPASGPDGLIIEDTLYSTFMNGASGTNRVYFNKSSVSELMGSEGQLVSGDLSGLSQENYPRIANDKNAVALVWKQSVNGKSQLPILLSRDITNGSFETYDTVAIKNVLNADVSITGSKVMIVWQDSRDRTVKFRSGTYKTSTNISDNIITEWSISPNPTTSTWQLSGIVKAPRLEFDLFNTQGELIQSKSLSNIKGDNSIEIGNTNLESGYYILRVSNNEHQQLINLIKQ